MADNCYFWVNNLVNIRHVKIETNTKQTYEEAYKNKEFT